MTSGETVCLIAMKPLRGTCCRRQVYSHWNMILYVCQKIKKQKAVFETFCYRKQPFHWCGHGDLNPNALLHRNLNPACLPVPSCPHMNSREIPGCYLFYKREEKRKKQLNIYKVVFSSGHAPFCQAIGASSHYDARRGRGTAKHSVLRKCPVRIDDAILNQFLPERANLLGAGTR